MPIFFGNNREVPSGMDKVFFGSNLVFENGEWITKTGQGVVDFVGTANRVLKKALFKGKTLKVSQKWRTSSVDATFTAYAPSVEFTVKRETDNDYVFTIPSYIEDMGSPNTATIERSNWAIGHVYYCRCVSDNGLNFHVILKYANIEIGNRLFIPTEMPSGNVCIKRGGLNAGVYTVHLGLFDLTDMCGAGNEPTTKAEALALLSSLDKKHYPQGTYLVSNDSKWSNGTDEVDLTTIKLNGVGTAQDTFEVQTGKLDRAMDEVDLGTLNWRYDGIGHRFTVNFLDIKASDDWNETKFICSHYKIGIPQYDASGGDKIIGLFGNQLFIRDTNYTDATAFKSAMSGVKLVYELATPTTEYLTPQPISQHKGCNSITQIDGSLANTDIEVQYFGKQA